MEQVYCLSAEALLYAVLRLHKPGIYGLPNVMPKLSDKDFPAFAQDAELELMNAGCGNLNFDGEFALESDFAALLGSCADCRNVVGASLHCDGVWQKMTLYPAAGAVLKRAEDFICTLSPAMQPMQVLMDALALPEDPEKLPPEIVVDTDVLENRDQCGVIAAGCNEAQANMILSALDGTGHYAHIRYVVNRQLADEILLLYGSEGILSASVEYSDQQEFLRLAPVSREQALLRLQKDWDSLTKEEVK